MKTILLTHANLKVPVQVFAGKLFYIYTSKTNGCVHLISDNGAICPVSEDEETILRKLTETKEVTDGTSEEG